MIPFWSVVAQIIPVLALALVIEVRVLARRLSREDGKLSTRQNYRRGMWIAVSWVSMVLTFMAALGFLIADPNLRMNSVSLSVAIAAALALVNAVALVALAPLGPVTLNLLALAIPDLLGSPWSPAVRAKRLYRRLVAEMRVTLLSARALKLQILVDICDLELARVQSERKLEKTAAIVRAAGRYFDTRLPALAMLATATEERHAYLREIDEIIQDIEERLDKAIDHASGPALPIDLIEKTERAARRYFAKVAGELNSGT